MSKFESIFERAAERKCGKAALQSLLPDGENMLDAINRMKKFRCGKRLNGLSIKNMIEEGRS